MQKIVRGIPVGNVGIKCPVVDFKPIRALDNCPSCPYFAGIGLMAYNPNVELSWSERYTIRCMHVIERRTFKLKGGD